jgi:hypothetical protein
LLCSLAPAPPVRAIAPRRPAPGEPARALTSPLNWIAAWPAPEQRVPAIHPPGSLPHLL